MASDGNNSEPGELDMLSNSVCPTDITIGMMRQVIAEVPSGNYIYM
jgi:hypothetical protein